MTASRRDTDRGSLLQSTMGSPQHRYPLRHKRKGADAGAEDGTSGLHRRSRTHSVVRSVAKSRERPLVSRGDNHGGTIRSLRVRSFSFARGARAATHTPLSALVATDEATETTRHHAHDV